MNLRRLSHFLVGPLAVEYHYLDLVHLWVTCYALDLNFCKLVVQWFDGPQLHDI